MNIELVNREETEQVDKIIIKEGYSDGTYTELYYQKIEQHY